MMLDQMNKSALLGWIDSVSFAVTDCNLYLDTHPEDQDAINYFRQYSEMREAALANYSKRFGPLTVDMAQPECNWDWISAPWPWEGGDAHVEL
jgi:spore coat protein JB